MVLIHLLCVLLTCIHEIHVQLSTCMLTQYCLVCVQSEVMLSYGTTPCVHHTHNQLQDEKSPSGLPHGGGHWLPWQASLLPESSSSVKIKVVVVSTKQRSTKTGRLISTRRLCERCLPVSAKLITICQLQGKDCNCRTCSTDISTA